MRVKQLNNQFEAMLFTGLGVFLKVIPSISYYLTS